MVPSFSFMAYWHKARLEGLGVEDACGKDHMKQLQARRLKGIIRFVRMVAGAIHVVCPSGARGQIDYGEVAEREEGEATKTASELKKSKSFNGIMGGSEIIIGKIHGVGFSIR